MRTLILLSLRLFLFLVLAGPAIVSAVSPEAVATKDAVANSPTAVAARLDTLLAEETSGNLSKEPSAGSSLANDETFIRRVYLDLVGLPPAPSDVTEFVSDRSADKRARLVDRLLDDHRFGENWGDYWRDVILYRRTDNRAAEIVAPALAQYLADSFNEHKPWDELATSFITAEGSVRANGATGLIAAQAGQTEDVTSEVSRIFLGIQIQCAQCHDHPTDRWKRNEFHNLAAFFPRIALRPSRSDGQLDFAISVTDNERRGRAKKNNNRYRGTLEHFMPDLQDPSAEGTLMEPVFFLTGQSLELGSNDETRRGQLAEWLTDRGNSWFAKAYVNRIWSELVGEGFYEPVDDIGPERECLAPQTLETLAQGFTQSGYDVHWVYRTITSTSAYQRNSRSRRNPNEAPFQANCLQRLRSDQLLNSILSLLKIPQFAADRAGLSRAEGDDAKMAAPMRRPGTPRRRFAAEFGFDPSERRDEIESSIPQALLLMNGPMFHQAIQARRSGLRTLLKQFPEDSSLVAELYLRAYSRAPTADESKICLDYIKEVGDREEAFQDIVWSMLNSTELLYRK